MLSMREPVQIVAGVWWLRGLRGCNVYAVRLDDGGVALIDCGAPGSAAAIPGALRAAGIDLGSVGTLLLTHRHPDHAAAAAALRERLGLAVVAGAGDVRDGLLRGVRGRRFARQRRAEPVTVDVALPADEESEPLPGLIAIPSPGHTDGSTCYLLPERELMFIGDVALRSSDRMSRPLSIANDDTATQERTLRMIAERAPANGAPGHGAPLIGPFGRWMRVVASKPPASGPWALPVVRNPIQIARFAHRMFLGS